MSYDLFAQSLDKKVRYYPDDETTKVIDMNDAELLAYFFWGRFMGKSELTEYQKFLWEKLKKTIVLTQTESTCRLRDSLYQFQKDHIEEEFYNYCDDKLALDISSLSQEDITNFTKSLLLRAQDHLKNPAWIQKWKQNQTYIIDTGYFFGSEASGIMCEMSPFFDSYKKNINLCGEQLWKYMHTEEGMVFENHIYSALSQELDLNSHHHATLIGICLWD